jgi:flagellin-like protein
MRGQHGVSPIVATVLLIGITVAAALPLAVFFTGMYPPARPRRTDVQVYAGLVNENIVRIHVQHIGGQTISNPLDPDRGIRGQARAVEVFGVENQIYCWTFKNPARFRQSDWAWGEIQLHGANLRVGSSIWINIWRAAGGGIWNGNVIIDRVDKIPG